jgi:hypothetical protein
MHLADTLPLVVDTEYGANTVTRTIEVARTIKEGNSPVS